MEGQKAEEEEGEEKAGEVKEETEESEGRGRWAVEWVREADAAGEER